MTEKIPYSGKKDFLEKRHPWIGSSDIGVICGVNPYQTRIDKYLEKIGSPLFKKIDPFSFSVFIGSNMEETVAKWFEHKTGKKVHRTNYMYLKDGFKVANPDRLIYGEKTILECKTTASFRSDAWEEGEFRMPEDYRYQINWQMGIMEYEKAVIVCANFIKKDFDQREMSFDPELFAYQEKIAGHFNECVQKRELPAAFAEDRDKLYDFIPKENTLVETDTELIEYAELLAEIDAMKKELKAKENTLKGWQADIIQDYEGAGLKCGNLILDYKWITSERFDTARFREDHPELYYQYKKETKPYAKFTLREEKV